MAAEWLILPALAAPVGWTWLSSRRASARWPALGRFREVSGRRLHVMERGEAHAGRSSVLLLHGAASNAREPLESLAGHLEGLHLLMPDRPGHGHSPRRPGDAALGAQAEAMAGLIRMAGTGPVVAVGHSWGSAVGLRLALDHPDTVKALVLLAPASHPWGGTTTLVNRIATLPLLGDALVWTLPALLGPLLMQGGIERGFAPGPAVERYGERIGTPLLFRPDTFRANAEDMAAADSELRAQAVRYPSLRLPVAIISGEGDRIVSNAIHAKALAADLPRALTRCIDGAGHMPHWVDPSGIAATIRALADKADCAPDAADG